MKQACEVPWYWALVLRWRVGLTVNRTAPAVDDCPRAVVAPGKSEGSIVLACRLLPRRWRRQAAATSCHYELPLRDGPEELFWIKRPRRLRMCLPMRRRVGVRQASAGVV